VKGQTVSLTIGVDVGGTKVAAGVVDCQGRIIEKLRLSTPAASPEDTANGIGEAVLALLARHEVEAIGVGAAGFVDETSSTVVFAPNLAWRDEPVKKQVEARVGVPVIVENDANAAAWAEVTFGAARGQRHVMLITVGTGIGAGIRDQRPALSRPMGDGGGARALSSRSGGPPVRMR
jgi:glucokinase